MTGARAPPTAEKPFLPLGSSIPIISTGGDLKRLVDRQIPQVFVTVVRSEQQVYAANLRRQMLRHGVQVRLHTWWTK